MKEMKNTIITTIIVVLLFVSPFVILAGEINFFCKIWEGSGIPDPYFFKLRYEDRVGTPPFNVICREREGKASQNEFVLKVDDTNVEGEEGVIYLPLEKFEIFSINKDLIRIQKQLSSGELLITVSYPAGVGGPGSHWKGQVFIVLPPGTMKGGEKWEACIIASRNLFSTVFEAQTNETFQPMGIWWEVFQDLPPDGNSYTVCKEFQIFTHPVGENQRIGFDLTVYGGEVQEGKLLIKEVTMQKIK